MKIVSASLWVVLTLSALLGCGDFNWQHHDGASFFGGDVTVKYSHFGHKKTPDCILFKFKKPGVYNVTFSQKSRGFGDVLPEEFEMSVGDAPCEYKGIRWGRLPYKITVTIERNGEKESHDLL